MKGGKKHVFYKEKKWKMSLNGDKFEIEPFNGKSSQLLKNDSYFMNHFEHPDGDKSMVFIQEVMTGGMFKPLYVQYSVLYESSEQEEDAKRFLLDSLIQQKTEEKSSKLPTVKANCSEEKLEELKNKLHKNERWCKLELRNEKFKIEEFDRESNTSIEDSDDEGNIRHDFCGNAMSVCCRKKNLEYWKKELVKEMMSVLNDLTKRAKVHYENTKQENDKKLLRLQKLQESLENSKKEKK